MLAMLDVHSHVLPGLDDGVETLADSMTVLKGLKGMGFSHVVATPHYSPGLYTPSAETVASALAAVRERLRWEEIPIEVLCGRECLLAFELTSHPEAASFPFTWEGRKFQLFELLHVTEPDVIDTYMRKLRSEGIHPILAHAERYRRITERPESVAEYAEIGFKIQVDLLSLGDSAPKALRKTASRLMETGYVDLLATDIHKPGQLDPMRAALEKVKKEYGSSGPEKYFSLD
jgi:protein-tyrosine phosphatase